MQAPPRTTASLVVASPDPSAETALAAGATSEHAPAFHPEYHDDYYGAFVTDPHGISIEAVCHRAV